MNRNKKLQKAMATVCLATIGVSMLAGCNGGKETATTVAATTKAGETAATTVAAKAEPTKIKFMTSSYMTDPIVKGSATYKAIEEYCNVDLDMQFVPSTTYTDKMNITLASGDLPDIMLAPDKSASIIQAAKVGAFWEVGDKLGSYPNLSQMIPSVLNNTSIDGKVYGLYRARAYARNGISYRQDWLKNVGMTEVKTVDDFYNMLYKFTYEDPDKNGANDTYGMAVAKFIGPFNITGTWFDAGNAWVEAADGTLQPSFMTKGYMENLDFWKKMYENKVINEDFAILDNAKWVDDLNNSKAGVIVDVLDNSGRIQDKITKADPTKTENMMAISTVEGAYGKKNLPTSGYSGMFVFPKQATKDEARLGELLTFMDKLSDKVPNGLINNGIEGKNFTMENGKYTVKTEVLPENSLNDINQISTLITTPDNGYHKNYSTPVRKIVDELQVVPANIEACVANPALPLTSPTYSTKGTQLEDVIETARVKYIMGQLDANGFNEAVELWKKQGGTDVMKEYSDAYKATK